MSELPRLYINVDPDYDWLIAIEFGRVDDGQPPENWRGVSEDFGYLHDGPADIGLELGFRLNRFSSVDLEDPTVAEIWGEPHFDAPQLGLLDASAGEIVLATRQMYGAENHSLNRVYFSHATGLEGSEAVSAWIDCLQSGDSMAHFALGYSLHELGRFHEAYRHLRYYATIAPAQPWAQCWFGKAAQSIGETVEARSRLRAGDRADGGRQGGDRRAGAAGLPRKGRRLREMHRARRTPATFPQWGMSAGLVDPSTRRSFSADFS